MSLHDALAIGWADDEWIAANRERYDRILESSDFEFMDEPQARAWVPRDARCAGTRLCGLIFGIRESEFVGNLLAHGRPIAYRQVELLDDIFRSPAFKAFVMDRDIQIDTRAALNNATRRVLALARSTGLTDWQ